MALTRCRECDKLVSTEATTCPHCGAPEPTAVVAQPVAQPVAQQRPVTEKPKSRSCLAFVILAALLLCGFLFLGNFGSDAPSSSTSSGSSGSSTSSGSSGSSTSSGSSGSSTSSGSLVSVGDDATITSVVAVARTKADFDEFTKLAVANDEIGGNQMINSGRVFVVEAGTSVKVIEIGLLAYRVRVTSGSHAGRDGWVIREAVGR